MPEGMWELEVKGVGNLEVRNRGDEEDRMAWVSAREGWLCQSLGKKCPGERRVC